MDETVKDGIGECRVAHQLVPVVDRELAGDECGSAFVAVFEDLEQITALLVGHGRETEVVQHDNCPGSW